MLFKKIFVFFIIMLFVISFPLLEQLLVKINPFLLNAIRFTLLSSLIFLLFERKILINLKNIYKKSIILGVFLFFAFTTLNFAILYSSYYTALVFFICSFFLYYNYKKRRPVSIAVIFICLIISLIELMSFKNIFLGIILNILLLFFTLLCIHFGLKYKNLFNEYLKESVFASTAVVAIFSIIAFLITKPSSAPFLTENETSFLALLVISSTILPFFVFSCFKNIFDGLETKLILIFMIISPFAALLIDFSIFLFAILFALIFSLFEFKRKAKGYAKLQVIAFITLSAMLISLIFPAINTFKERKIINQDVKLLSSGLTTKNTLPIKNIYIKSFNNKPKYIYHKSSKITVIPIR